MLIILELHRFGQGLRAQLFWDFPNPKAMNRWEGKNRPDAPEELPPPPPEGQARTFCGVWIFEGLGVSDCRG